jgi:hypothetical protein
LSLFDTTMLAGLPALIALILCIKRGPGYAFLNVYLPVLLLLPDGCRMATSGQFNFNESAIIPIAAFFLWKEGRHWKWTLTDLLVVALVALISVAQYMNSDYQIAQNLALRLIVTILLPYVVAKGLIVGEEGISVEIAKRIVILATVVAILSAYEFRMTANPFRAFMSPWFPAWIVETPSFRYGFVRIAGPWSHPILAGIILAVAYRTARWLEWTHNWPGNVPLLPISKARFCELALIVGGVMTISRGPWIGAIVAAAIVMLLRSRHRKHLTAFALCLIFIFSIPAYLSFDRNVDLDRYGPHEEAKRSAAYREELIEKYIVIAEERPVWGWGSSGFPVVDGMTSVDNQYLLLALTSGLYALAAMVLILLWVPARICRYGLLQSDDESKRSLAFTLTGIFILCALSIATVYLGAQTQPLLFVIAGWSEALLVAPSLIAARVPYRFQRVMI